MPKNIVFCADGTWNGPHEPDSDDPNADASNVFKLYLNLAGRDAAGTVRLANEQERTLTDDTGQPAQVAKYLHGVGDSQNALVKLLGGALGTGLITRIVRGYTFVSRNYLPGDKIFLIGFSRGAYTARALAGFIAAKGLLNARTLPLDDKEQAYRLGAAVWYDYRQEAVRTNKDWLGNLQQWALDLPHFVSEPATKELLPDVRMAAVAVWDTVGALGIPQYARDSERIDTLQFVDTDLNPKVANGLHAVSIDERRADFTPTLWNAREGVTQVLFAGAHADVGGGYPADESGLSDTAFQWMTNELTNLGVRFSAAPAAPANPNPSGTAHEPWEDPPYDKLRRITRDFPRPRVVHAAVNARMNAGPVKPDPKKAAVPYRPANI